MYSYTVTRTTPVVRTVTVVNPQPVTVVRHVQPTTVTVVNPTMTVTNPVMTVAPPPNVSIAPPPPTMSVVQPTMTVSHPYGSNLVSTLVLYVWFRI